MLSWLIAVMVLGLMVLVHELGHFLVARWSGVRVTRFSIGFGPKLLSWHPGQTEYCLCLLPLGGYVKLAGDERQEQTQAPWEFLSKAPGVRARIIVAGPFVNYLVSLITLWAMFVIGYPELRPHVGRLIEGMPAKVAGLQVGDRILAVDGTPVHTWDELTRLIRQALGRPMALELDRAGTLLALSVTPTIKQIKDPFGRVQVVGVVGMMPSGAVDTLRVSPLEAIPRTAAKHAEWISQIGLSLWSLMTGRVSAGESVTGPIGILFVTAEAARMGLGPLLYLVSIFSLSLALFNLFPIPILDGGHLLFLALEKLRGAPVNVSLQERAAQVSMVLFVLLLAMVCANDLQRFGLVEKVLHWWRGS